MRNRDTDKHTDVNADGYTKRHADGHGKPNSHAEFNTNVNLYCHATSTATSAPFGVYLPIVLARFNPLTTATPTPLLTTT